MNLESYIKHANPIVLFITWVLLNTNNLAIASDTLLPPPNIVIIMADDIGYSDIGCYGSEIETPNLDRLAHNGMRFKSFYNMAKCNPTRSTMITGQYQGDESAISFVPLLRDAGYSAIMSGKEHFDSWVPQHCYFAETFEQSFTFWATTEYFVPPDGTFERPFYLNGKEIPAEAIEAELYPKYKTDFITDYALKWLDEVMQRDQPFLLLLPYHAAHYPLQARPEDIAKYRGKYRNGWEEIREARFQKMKQLGIIEADVLLSPAEGNTNRFRGHPDGWPEIREKWPTWYRWDSMTAEEQDDKDLEMAVFAAMIDRMDQNIGRVLDRLEQAGAMDNTLIIFFTDNGSCPFDSNKDFDIPPGPAESYRCLSPPWANVGNTPYRLYKQNGHEGGARTHFIAHWPRWIQPGTITSTVGHVIDLFPTFLDASGVDYPELYDGIRTSPLQGRSLLPVFQDRQPGESTYWISGHTAKFRMYREGDWKLVRQNGDAWELYNLAEDPTELSNLAGRMPGKLEQMIGAYQESQIDAP